MTRVNDADQILQVSPTLPERKSGARYAAISLFWTYDRMRQEAKRSNATRNQAFNIAKGLVGQKCLQRALDERGVEIKLEEKSHRETDSYDLRFPEQSSFSDLDLKTFNHFTDYGVDEKPPLDRNLIGDNIDYEGPEWGHFFPMLVPYDQFSQDKEAYCFAISSSIDYRSHIEGRGGYELYAYPDTNNAVGEFLVSDIEGRESRSEALSISVKTSVNGKKTPLELKVIGEINGNLEERWIEVTSTPTMFGPVSGVASFKITEETYRTLDNQGSHIEIEVASSPADDALSRNSLKLTTDDFHNLLMPSEFTFYFVGWITKQGFKSQAQTHPGWRRPSRDEFTRNKRWTDLSDRDERFLRGNELGWTIADDRAVQGAVRQDAGCYYYPKLDRQNMDWGGLQRTNLYVLPGDLRPMDEF